MTPSATPPAAALQSIRAALEEADLARAGKELQALLPQHAADAAVRTLQARVAAGEGRAEEALSLLRAVVAAPAPVNAEAQAYLGALLVGRRQYDEGVEHRAAAMEQGADIPAAHHAMGVALAAVEEYEEALHFLGRAALAMPTSASTYLYLGVCHAELGGLDDAVTALTACVALQPGLTDAWELLARVHGDRQDPEVALRAVEDGLEHARGDVRLLRLRVQLLLDFGRHDLVERAASAIPEAARSGADDAAQAVAALSCGRPADALLHARHAVAREPDLWSHHHLLGVALESQRPVDHAAVLEAYRRAVALGDPEGAAGTRLGLLLTMDLPGADPLSAVTVLEAARQRSRDSPATLLNLAVALARCRRTTEADALCALLLGSGAGTPSVREQAARLRRALAQPGARG